MLNETAEKNASAKSRQTLKTDEPIPVTYGDFSKNLSHTRVKDSRWSVHCMVPKPHQRGREGVLPTYLGEDKEALKIPLQAFMVGTSHNDVAMLLNAVTSTEIASSDQR